MKQNNIRRIDVTQIIEKIDTKKFKQGPKPILKLHANLIYAVNG
jgi:hypothetical protein